MAIKPKQIAKTRARAIQTTQERRVAQLADALMVSIERELHDVPFFTREDLLHVSAFSYVATITRYRYVCEAVSWLLRKNRLHSKSRTDLFLTGNASKFVSHDARLKEYASTVARLMRTHGRNPFSVMDIVDNWRTDPHLTQNIKRTIVRDVLRALVTEQHLVRLSPGVFQVAQRETIDA